MKRESPAEVWSGLEMMQPQLPWGLKSMAWKSAKNSFVDTSLGDFLRLEFRNGPGFFYMLCRNYFTQGSWIWRKQWCIWNSYCLPRIRAVLGPPAHTDYKWNLQWLWNVIFFLESWMLANVSKQSTLPSMIKEMDRLKSSRNENQSRMDSFFHYSWLLEETCHTPT